MFAVFVRRGQGTHLRALTATDEDGRSEPAGSDVRSAHMDGCAAGLFFEEALPLGAKSGRVVASFGSLLIDSAGQRILMIAEQFGDPRPATRRHKAVRRSAESSWQEASCQRKHSSNHGTQLKNRYVSSFIEKTASTPTGVDFLQTYRRIRA